MYRNRQLHLWITDHDYLLLRKLAQDRKETLSSVIRRLIKLQGPDRNGVEAIDAGAQYPAPAGTPSVWPPLS